MPEWLCHFGSSRSCCNFVLVRLMPGGQDQDLALFNSSDFQLNVTTTSAPSSGLTREQLLSFLYGVVAFLGFALALWSLCCFSLGRCSVRQPRSPKRPRQKISGPPSPVREGPVVRRRRHNYLPRLPLFG